MNKICFIFFCLLPVICFSQTLGQDKEGFSSLVLSGAILNLDLANEIASFAYYDCLGENDGLLIGGEVKGKSENGVSNLFDEGQLTNSSSISGLIGHYFLEGDNEKDVTTKITKLDAKYTAKDKEQRQNFSKLRSLHSNNSDNSDFTGPFDDTNLNTVIYSGGDKREVKKILALVKNKIDELNKISPKSPEQNRALNSLKSVETELGKVLTTIDELVKIEDEIEDEELELYHWGSLIYTRWQVSGVTFRQDTGNQEPAINLRFPKIEFNGWRGELGYNFKYGKSFVGVAAAGNYTNNISELEQKTFTFILDDATIEPGTLRTTSTISAYGADEFDDFHRYDLLLDYSRIIRIKGSEKLMLSLNPYIRHSFFHNSRDFKDHTNMGVGLFAINVLKSQLLGGAFIQFNDVFGKNNTTEETKTSLDRANFGLVVRFGFTGIDVKDKG